MKYLYGADGKIIGRYEEQRNKRIVYDKDRYVSLGYYDAKENRTYDAYNNCIAEGDVSADLPYYLHEIRFPLPDMERVRFTIRDIKRVTAPKMSYSSSQDDYWDNGRCEICMKHHRTCRISGFPSMCETCYRFMKLYGNTDTLELARESKRHRIPIEKYRKAVEITKAPYIAAEKAAEAELRRTVIQGIKDLAFSGAEHMVSNRNHDGEREAVVTKTNTQKRVTAKSNNEGKEGKRKLSLSTWLIIIFVGIPVIKALIALIVYAVLYFNGVIQ